MRFAIVGSGAVGGYFGAKLVQSGHEVTFLARGAHLEALRRRGWRSAVRPETSPSRCARSRTRPRGPGGRGDVGGEDVRHHRGAPAVKTLVSGTAVVLTLQNGVDSPDEVASAVGREAVLGGSAYISAALTAPGVLTQTGLHQRITLGEYFGDTSRGFRRAWPPCTTHSPEPASTRSAVADARVSLWDKLVFLAPFAGLTGSTRLPHRRAARVSALARHVPAGRHRGHPVAAAEGVTVTRTPESLLRELQGLPPQTRASLLVDLEQGKRLEVEALLGSVVRRGRTAGVPTPVMATLHGVLAPYANGRPPA